MHGYAGTQGLEQRVSGGSSAHPVRQTLPGAQSSLLSQGAAVLQAPERSAQALVVSSASRLQAHGPTPSTSCGHVLTGVLAQVHVPLMHRWPVGQGKLQGTHVSPWQND
jgi:hypothetical protein